MKIDRSEGGHGGKLGHSNMTHWDDSADIKDLARILRRRQDKTEADGIDTNDDDICSICAAPFEPYYKWNGGNPKMIMFPTCDCEDLQLEIEMSSWHVLAMNKHLKAAEARQRAIDALNLGCSLKVIKAVSETECQVDFDIARSLVATGIAQWDNHPQGGTNFQRIIAKQQYIPMITKEQ